jgi:hypothetical protein
MTTLALLVGLWTSTCIQTQVAPTKAGFVKESYEFGAHGDYRFTREWFDDSACTVSKDTDEEEGQVVLGKRLSGMFVSGETYELDFTSAAGTEYGAVQLKENSLRLARGIKGSLFRNTMVGLFDYVKE